MLLLDKKGINVNIFPNAPDLEKLAINSDIYFKRCITSALNGQQEIYQNNYIAYNQVHSLLRELNKNYKIEGIDLNKMEDRMYWLQTSKQKLDNLQ